MNESKSTNPAPAQQLALYADQLRDLSAAGLIFSDSIYDRERYQAIQEIAMALLTLATGDTLDDLEPLRAPIFSRFTPLIGGDAAVIDERGRILLIQRSDNQCWAMPGGALEVGETPLEGVIREVMEETGVPCEPAGLVGIYDSRRCGLPSRHHIYLLTFLLKPTGGEPRAISHSNEILDLRWFAEDDLPHKLHPGSLSRIAHAYRLWRGQGQTFYDT